MIFDKDNWLEIAGTLKQNKLRSFLTAFGVFWGIFMLIIMVAGGNGLYNGAMRDFQSLAANSVFLWTRPTTQPFKGFPRGRKFNFDNDDVAALRSHIPEIEHLAPRNQLGGFGKVTNVTRAMKDGAFNVYGDYPEIAYISLMDIVAGRFINHLDLKEKRKVAVIGTRVREILFEPDEDPIGQNILVKGVYFKVIGAFESRKEGDEADKETQAIFLPFTIFQQAFNYGNLVSWFSLTARKDVPASEVEKKAIAFLAERHHVAPDDVHAIGHWNTEKEYKKMTNLFIGINALIWFVGTCTLIAGVIGVSNIMLFVVKERTREIGIKRAIGATPFAIISQIMLESVLLTTVAGYFGLVLGVGLLELINMLLESSGADTEMFLHPGVNFNMAVTALTILIISGMLAGLIPAKKAVSLKPIDALRFD